MKEKDIIKKLRDDKEYYEGEGKKYFSASGLKTLLNEPGEYGKKTKETEDLVLGSYFHTCVLEPHKKKNYPIWTDTEIRSKAYKEHIATLGKDWIMKQSDADKVHGWVEHLNKVTDLSKVVNDKNSLVEEPTIKKIKINGKEYYFKGKADLIIKDQIIIDLKTTNDKNIDLFLHNAKYNWHYDLQAFIYNQLWNLPVKLIAFCKQPFETHDGTIYHKVYECEVTKRTALIGEEKLINAINIFEDWYGENKTMSINETIKKPF